MIKPNFPKNEAQRQIEVESFELLDTQPTAEFDAITKLCAELTDSPISYISLIDEDRNWFKSHFGLPLKEDPRENSFCGHAINYPKDIFIVPNTLKDERFFDNPLVTNEAINARFYAGVPILSKSGLPLGSLCIFDTKPKKITEQQKGYLMQMSKQVALLMEYHKSTIQLKREIKTLESKYDLLQKLPEAILDKRNSPLTLIEDIVERYLLKNSSVISEEDTNKLESIENEAQRVRNIIKNSISYNKNENLIIHGKKRFSLSELIEECKLLTDPRKIVKFITNIHKDKIRTNKPGFKNILEHLISNAIAFNDKEKTVIHITTHATSNGIELNISDNGPGISKDSYEAVFNIFENEEKDSKSESKFGIGLATVKRTVDQLDGKIELSESVNKGLSVTIVLPN